MKSERGFTRARWPINTADLLNWYFKIHTLKVMSLCSSNRYIFNCFHQYTLPIKLSIGNLTYLDKGIKKGSCIRSLLIFEIFFLKLTFRELESLTCTRLTRFLSFNFSRVTSKESSKFKLSSDRWI